MNALATARNGGYNAPQMLKRKRNALVLQRAWRSRCVRRYEGVRCRNGTIADFNAVLSGCTRANAVPYTLGAGEHDKEIREINKRNALHGHGICHNAAIRSDVDANPVKNVMDAVDTQFL